jgi:K+-sensing histidine kinase KdpD
MAAITHDLKSPLNAILGFCEVLRDNLENARRIPDEDRQDMLKSIGMGQHMPDMMKLIVGILTMTRIEVYAKRWTYRVERRRRSRYNDHYGGEHGTGHTRRIPPASIRAL